jgi:N6-adenosine-specific RNA methylase IME4
MSADRSTLLLFGQREEPLWRCGLIDPPWDERGGGKCKRGADRHYPTQKTPDILRALRDSGHWRPYPDAHLWCWVTDTFMCNGEGLWLIQQLGFEPKCSFPWIKVGEMPEDVDELELEDTRAGIGQYARKVHEHLVLAVRGSGMHPSVCTERRDIRSTIIAPHERGLDGKIIHSRKPAATYDLIEARSRGPYWEGFATLARPGWLTWGPLNHHAVTLERAASSSSMSLFLRAVTAQCGCLCVSDEVCVECGRCRARGDGWAGCCRCDHAGRESQQLVRDIESTCGEIIDLIEEEEP